MVAVLLYAAVVALGQREPNSPAERSVRDELIEYYKDPRKPRSWEKSIKELSDAEPAVRAKATGTLVAVLSQANEDEKSGEAPWQATPFWGRGAENLGRELRASICRGVEETRPSVELLPVVRWLVENEPQARLQESMAVVLAKIEGDDADRLRGQLAVQPHRNAIVAGMAIEQIRERKKEIAAPRLKELCHHHRKVIRDAARKLNEQLKYPDPGNFDPVAALKSRGVRAILDDLQKLMYELPDKNAEFVEITIKYLEKDVVKETGKSQGWLVDRDKNSVTLDTPFGTRETLHDKQSTQITVGKRIENGYQSWQIPVVTSIDVAKVGIDSYVKEIADVRAEGNKEFQLSARGGLTGQFEGQGASTPEILLAAWLDRAGRPELTAKILLPALDTLYADEHLVEMAKHRLGNLLGNRMLVAFVGDRDYERALKLAQAHVKHYGQTQFSKYAQNLAAQLPKRMDDFKTLKLPTPEEWAALKAKMARREQIDFLCQRLRLLNCFQWGQPGGYDPTATQYAEPCGLSDNAAWGRGKGKTKVINPVSELFGRTYGGFRFEGDTEEAKGMNLTVADIPILVPHLRDDWYLLIVSFWRDFSTDRNLSNSRSYVERWINDLAKHDVCKMEGFDAKSPEQKAAHLKRIVDWAEANKGKSEDALRIEAVEREIAAGGDWRSVGARVESLVESRNPKALGFVEHFLASADEDSYHTSGLLDHVRSLDPKKAVVWAKKFLTRKDERLRMQSAMIVFASDEKELAIPVLARLLESGSRYALGPYAGDAVERLLKLNAKEATDAAASILRNKALREPETRFDDGLPILPPPYEGPNRAAIVEALAKAGHPEGFRIYLELLDVQGNQYGNSTYGRPVAKLAVAEILSTFGGNDDELGKLRQVKDDAERRLAVRRWVEARLDKNKKGQ